MAGFYEEVLAALEGAGVDYIVVGGLAVVLHGVPRTTVDLDLMVRPEEANLRNLVSVLTELGLRPRAPVDPLGLTDSEQRRRWREEKGMVAFSFVRGEGAFEEVDVLLDAPVDYDEALADALLLQDEEGHRLRIASIDTLIALKRETGRAQDDSDVEALTRLKEALDEAT